MALKLIPPGQGGKLREYYIRFEGSMYGVLHVDNEAHTVDLVPLKELDNIPVFVEPLDPYKLCGVRVFYSSSFRMVLCFFDRFYVTVGDMHVLESDSPQAYMEHMRVSLYDAVLFPPVVEGQETNPWRTLSRSDDVDAVWLCDSPPRGGRRQSRPGQLLDPDSMQAVEGSRRLFDAEASPGLRDLRSVGGEQLFDGFVAFDVCL